MRFDIMTLFPELVNTVLGESIIGRAQKSGAIEIESHNIRDFSEDKHRRVDDTPYGGGKGMLMMAPPIYNCYEHIMAQKNDAEAKTRVIFMSPAGKIFESASVIKRSGMHKRDGAWLSESLTLGLSVREIGIDRSVRQIQPTTKFCMSLRGGP